MADKKKGLTDKQKTRVRNALTVAITMYDSQAELARKMGVTLPYVNKIWLTGHVPTEQLKNFEKATRGVVKRQDLRPDLFD